MPSSWTVLVCIGDAEKAEGESKPIARRNEGNKTPS